MKKELNLQCFSIQKCGHNEQQWIIILILLTEGKITQMKIKRQTLWIGTFWIKGVNGASIKLLSLDTASVSPVCFISSASVLDSAVSVTSSTGLESSTISS